ncbi:MAG TPA: thioredoxin family protein, partial [Labilithrix sp.]
MRGSVLCLVALVACGKMDDPSPTVWHDLASGEAVARREHRPVVVFVHARWSTADVMLERESFPSPAVRRAMRGFVAIDVDASDDEDPKTRAATQRFCVRGVPTIVVLDAIDVSPCADREDGDGASPDLYRASSYLEPR